MVDFISEVQEELRKDDYNRWLKKYGPYLLGLIISIVLAASYFEWKKASDDRKSRATSAVYMSATQKAEDGNIDGALSDFLALSKKVPSGYGGLSLLRASELELEKGNQVEAVKLLDEAAQTFELARHKQLSQMKAAYILAGEGRYADVKARVTPLAETGQPYEYLARELLGFVDKENGDIAGARKQFAYLDRMPGVPDDLRQRAEQYLSIMQFDESQQLKISSTTPGSESDMNEDDSAEDENATEETSHDE